MSSQKRNVGVWNEFHCEHVMCNHKGATELMNWLVSSQQEQSTYLLILNVKLLRRLERKRTGTLGVKILCRKAYSFPRHCTAKLTFNLRLLNDAFISNIKTLRQS